MSTQACMACRATPASVFCSAHAAFLCPPCDEVIHPTDKLVRPHHRIPFHSILPAPEPTLSPPPTPRSLQPLRTEHSPDKTSSADTALNDSDQSSHPAVMPDTHTFATPFSLAAHIPSPQHPQLSQTPVPSPNNNNNNNNLTQQRLSSIANAYIKQEAHQLYHSTKPHSFDPDFVRHLGLSVMRELATSMSSRVPTATNTNNPPRQPPPSQPTRASIPSLTLGCPLSSLTPSAPPASSTTCTDGESSTPSDDVQSDAHPSDSIGFGNARTDEQKRRDRQAALKRFRDKKASRSFRKKVRYECRKQLADSRPRSKGRFVGRTPVSVSGGILKQKTSKR